MDQVTQKVFLNRVCANWENNPPNRDGITQTVADLYTLTFMGAQSMIQSRIAHMKKIGAL